MGIVMYDLDLLEHTDTVNKLLREIYRMVPGIQHSTMEYKKDKLNSLQELVEEDEINYDKIVDEVESILS